MNLDSQLLLGLVLIAIGIVLAVLAYTFVVSRRDDEVATKEPKIEAADVPTISVEPEAPRAQPPAPPVAIAAPAPELATAKPTPPPARPQMPLPAPPPPATASSLKRTFPVATLLRDEVTGKLLVEIGEREYANVKELRDSKDYGRVEFAAADLARWFGSAPTTRIADRADVARADREEPVKPKSMIEQINEILERRLAEAPGVQRGVRLMEGSGGALRVLIGLQGYNFDDVPDTEVRRIIREAVAEWEAKR